MAVVINFGTTADAVDALAVNKSDWVDWEINKFYEMKKNLWGDKTWKRIRGMTLKGSDNAIIPAALYNGRSTQWLVWDPEALDRWLDLDPDA